MVQRRPDYGIDSPAMVVAEVVAAGIAGAVTAALLALGAPRLFGVPSWIFSLAVGLYLLLMAGGMVHYSKIGKLRIRDRLLRAVPWRGHERVLDVGCGRGLLLVGAARHLTDGRATGVDRWVPGAVSGNRPEAALRNAELEGAADRVEVRDGDARGLPFADASFDVVVSNFVVHEMDSGAERERMLREMARVLKPGGRVALVDFVFTGHAARVLRECGVRDARRAPAGWLAFGSFALLTLGLGQLCEVVGTKDPAAPAAE